MLRFIDQRTLDVYETRFHAEVPEKVSKPAHEVLRLLVASHDLQDVGIIGRIHVLKKLGRLGVHVKGKWFVTFEWLETFGARAILLERRKEKD